jgi:hypothetical protein
MAFSFTKQYGIEKIAALWTSEKGWRWCQSWLNNEEKAEVRAYLGATRDSGKVGNGNEFAKSDRSSEER